MSLKQLTNNIIDPITMFDKNINYVLNKYKSKMIYGSGGGITDLFDNGDQTIFFSNGKNSESILAYLYMNGFRKVDNSNDLQFNNHILNQYSEYIFNIYKLVKMDENRKDTNFFCHLICADYLKSGIKRPVNINSIIKR